MWLKYSYLLFPLQFLVLIVSLCLHCSIPWVVVFVPLFIWCAVHIYKTIKQFRPHIWWVVESLISMQVGHCMLGVKY